MDLENQTHILDVDRISEMRESLGSVALASLFGRFLKEGDGLLEHLLNPEIRRGPLIDVIAAVHKVASSAAVLGAVEMHAHLQHIENVSKSEPSANLWKVAHELEPIWLRTKSSLNESGFVIS